MQRTTSRVKAPLFILSILATFSLLLLLPQDLAAEDWKIYAGTDEGRFYYDIESVAQPAKDIIHLRHKASFSENGVRRVVEILGGEEYKNLDYSISVREINCSEKKIRSLGVTYFSKSGKALDAAVDFRTEWHPIEQTAVIEGLYQMVCKQ